MTTRLPLITGAIVGAAMSMTAAVAQAEKWDMPMAYSDGNFHTQNGKLFAEAVTIATGGKLEVIVHGGGSLFKGSEIKRPDFGPAVMPTWWWPKAKYTMRLFGDGPSNGKLSAVAGRWPSHSRFDA